MTYTIKNKFYNVLLTIIENIPILIAIDFMWSDDFLSKIFTPFYFLAPHIYLDRFNSFFSNECSIIILGEDNSISNSNNTFISNNSDINTNISANLSNTITSNVQNKFITNLLKYVFGRILQDYQTKINDAFNGNSSLFNSTTIIIKNITNEFIKNTNKSIDWNVFNITNNTINTPVINNTINDTNTDISEETKIYKIKFFSNVLMEFDNTYCIYNPTLLIIFYFLVVFILISFFIIGKFNPVSTKISCLKYSFVFILVNIINILVRPFAYLFFIVFLNRPIILLYQNSLINSLYFSNVIIYTVISIISFCIFLIFCILFNKYMNNAFFFEDYPYDFFSTSDTGILQIIKILIGFKFNFDKLIGFRYITFINYLLGLFITIRMSICVTNRQLIINNYLLKTVRNFFSFFFCIYLFLKLLNKNIYGLRYPNDFGMVIELLIIVAIIFIVITNLLKLDDSFTFKDKDEIINEILRFFYLMDNKLINSKYNNKMDSGFNSNAKSNFSIL